MTTLNLVHKTNIIEDKTKTVTISQSGRNMYIATTYLYKGAVQDVSYMTIYNAGTLSEANYERLKVGISKLLKENNMFRKNDTIFNLDDCRGDLVNKVLETDFKNVSEDIIIVSILSVLKVRQNISFESFVSLVESIPSVADGFVFDVYNFSMVQLSTGFVSVLGPIDESLVGDAQKFLKIICNDAVSVNLGIDSLAGLVFESIGADRFFKFFKVAGGFDLSYGDTVSLVKVFNRQDIDEYAALYSTRLGLNRGFGNGSFRNSLFDYELARVPDIVKIFETLIDSSEYQVMEISRFSSFLASLIIVAGDGGLGAVYEFLSMCLDDNGYVVYIFGDECAGERHNIVEFVKARCDNEDFYNGVSLQMYLDIIG